MTPFATKSASEAFGDGAENGPNEGDGSEDGRTARAQSSPTPAHGEDVGGSGERKDAAVEALATI